MNLANGFTKKEQSFLTYNQTSMELHGDRVGGDSKSIRCGFKRIKGTKCMVIICKGCPSANGYRKAHRCMKLANKFKLPIITLVNTRGAWPLEPAISHVIAQNLKLIATLRVPLVTLITEYAYSGGALALMSQRHVGMFSKAKYSVISPRGACAILKAPKEAIEEMEKALKITASDNLKLGVIEQIVDDESEATQYIIDCLRSEEWI